MRSKVYLMLIFVLSIMLIGCEKQGDVVDKTLSFNDKIATIEEYINNNISYIICEDVELIGEYSEFNATIE